MTPSPHTSQAPEGGGSPTHKGLHASYCSLQVEQQPLALVAPAQGPTVSSPPVAARMAASWRMLVVSSAFKLLGARPRPTFPFASLVVSTDLLPPSPRPCHRFGLIPIFLQLSLSLSLCLSFFFSTSSTAFGRVSPPFYLLLTACHIVAAIVICSAIQIVDFLSSCTHSLTHILSLTNPHSLSICSHLAVHTQFDIASHSSSKAGEKKERHQHKRQTLVKNIVTIRTFPVFVDLITHLAISIHHTTLVIQCTTNF